MNINARKTQKTNVEIRKEWDEIAELRDKQIASGQDISYNQVLVPIMLSLTEHADLRAVIDIGCGTGALTSIFADKADRVTGLDLSQKSIDLAKNKTQGRNNIHFIASSLEAYADLSSSETFTLAVANMTLMDALDLDAFLFSAAKLLSPGGQLIFSITHPFFWPLYWGYVNEDWFSYEQEIQIEQEFRISNDQAAGHVTTHVHRPLSRYIDSLSRAGFLTHTLLEPTPHPDVLQLYNTEWKYPRFIVGRCIYDNKNN